MIQFETQGIILDMKASSKNDALKELIEAVHPQCSDIDPTVLLTVLMEREQVGSTGVGHGIAIPHGKVPGLNEFLLCFGRSTKGIGFEAIDNRPVHLFVLILSPTGMSNEYLQTLARISRLLKDQFNRNLLFQAKTTKDILALFNTPET